jgi:hypothetical protein
MSKIDLIKERLNKLQSKNSGSAFEKIDFTTIFWKPKLGKQVVRILPRKTNKDFPFAEVSFHQYNIFKKNVYSLENFGEKDPVVQLMRELYDENTEESKDLARKLRPRTKFFAQVLVRGEEGMGARLWEFNKTTYEKLLSIMADDDFGDVSDVTEGTDLTVEGYNDVIKIGKRDVNYVAVNVTPKRSISPISEDAALVQKVLETQKEITEIYKKYSYDEIKKMLHDYINPQEAPTEEVSTPTVEAKTPIATDDTPPFEGPYQSVTPVEAAPKTNSVASKFDDLFGDEN